MIALTPEQKKKVQIALLVGAVILVILGWFWISIGSKKVSGLTAQVEELKKKDADLTRQLAELRELEKMRSQYALVEARLEQVSRRLPASPEAPGFQEALSDALRSTGIDIAKLAPEKINDFDQFTEIPYTIAAAGRYHELGQFLTLVEQNSQRFMRVKSLKMVNDDVRPSLHPVDVGIATFMFREK